MKQIATWIRECDEPAFARTFALYPGVRLVNARTEPASCDQARGLLLAGGTDISEPFLRQPVPDPGLIEGADPARDAWEFESVARALERKLPVLAICRGLQVLNVALGGTLHLDIPHHNGAKYENIQNLRYVENVPIQFPRVNSSHHQALDHLGAGLVVDARCAEDGVIEQAHLENYPFALGVQYHPERDALYRPLFDAFIHHATQNPDVSR
jgi:putative glutamine amidotransferase